VSYFYQNGHLSLGSIKSSKPVADFIGAYNGPTYIYDLDDIHLRFHAYEKAFSQLSKSTIHYAMKANSHPVILARLASWGAGVDTVSAGEIRKALQAGFKPEKIIFSGVAKTKKEIEFAVANRIKQINVESPSELERIIEISRAHKTVTDVAFRVNPDVNPKTHPYITTGFRENKFGMDESFLPQLIKTLRESKDAVKLRGLTMHIGSQLFDLNVFNEAIEKTLAVHHQFINEGFELDRFDVGGGIGIHYETPDATEELAMLASYGEMLTTTIEKHLSPTTEILAEPGRLIVARAGLLITEIQYIKQAPAKTFVIVDTGMHHLLRPALYQAKHRVLSLRESSSGKVPQNTADNTTKKTVDVVGPICESSDVLAKNVELPEIKAGDLLAIADAGAYGFAMANAYNSHELPREILVENGHLTPHLNPP
jgi:diaminopimelate decarboxylase